MMSSRLQMKKNVNSHPCPEGEASLIRREAQIKAVQRDKDETKADLERDIRMFTLAASGSVSNKAQIVAAASMSEDKHAGLPL